MRRYTTITQEEYRELKKRSDALLYISGVVGKNPTTKTVMKIQLGLVYKKLVETLPALYKEVANG